MCRNFHFDRFRPPAALVALVVLATTPPAGAEPYLVADLEREAIVQGSLPHELHALAAGVVFGAIGKNGTEIWASDGTPAGTRRLAVVADAGAPTLATSLATTADRWFFAAAEELWVTDGRADGTVRLSVAGQLRFTSPPTGVWVEELELLFFVGAGTDGVGRELWASDGTPAGTRRLRQFGGGATQVGSLVALPGAALFQVHTPAGDELWSSDGTKTGTQRLRTNELALSLTAGPSLALFFTRDGAVWRLWRSDGSVAGTVEVRELLPGPYEGAPQSRILAREDEFLIVGGAYPAQIWRSDGTAAGTHSLTSSASGFDPTTFCTAAGPGVVSDGIAYLPVGDFAEGCELWRSDGTLAGTTPITDCPGRCGSEPRAVTAVPGGGVFFLASTEEDGPSRPWLVATPGAEPLRVPKACPDFCFSLGTATLGDRVVFDLQTADPLASLWVTDGTPSGTRRLVSHPIRLGDSPFGAAVGDALILALDDGVHGVEPWRTDGGVSGTFLLADVAPSDTASSSSEFLAAGGGWAYFVAESGGTSRLWGSDGTEDGTLPFIDLASRDDVSLVPFENGVLAHVRAGGDSLWRIEGETATQLPEVFAPSRVDGLFVDGSRFFYSNDRIPVVSDGTGAGTRRLTGPEVALLGLRVPYFARSGDEVYFLADTLEAGVPVESGLWRTDGTEAGTERFVDFPRFMSPYGSLTGFGDHFAFVIPDPASGTVLWVSDGRAAGTYPLSNLGSQPEPRAVVGERLLFTTVSGNVVSLWTTDGTPGGTSVLMNVNVFLPWAGDSRLFYFTAVDSDGPYRLYRSDGTAAGTYAVLEAGSSRTDPVIVAGLLYFTLDDNVEPFAHTLWRSDGTAEGTFPIRGFEGDPYPETVRQTVTAGSRLLFTTGFSADFTVPANALWETDGTVAGTHRVAWPEGLEVPQSSMLEAGPRIFFAADDGRHGLEPWVLPIEDVVAADPNVLGLGAAARFEVELDWTDSVGKSGRASKAPLRTGDSGLLWFFADDNWEMLVKVLDACAIDGHYWVFAGAATNVGYTLRVTDTATGQVESYVNPLGLPARPIVDTVSFASCGAEASTSLPLSSSAAKIDLSCPEGVLCLGEDGRFRASMSWRRFDGATGVGHPVPGSPESGLFWFFDDGNWEALVKVLDGCQITDRFWVFAAATTTVEFTLRVEDSVTGKLAEYQNPLGRAAPAITDTAALDVCP